MKTLRLHTSVLAATLVLAGCADRVASPVGTPPSEESLPKSNVFDGRDSVATGIDGLTATQDNLTVVTEFIQVQGDAGLVDILDPDNIDPATPLFESREKEPILAPDGSHVTWGNFSGVQGATIVKCTAEGTHVVTHFSELIPRGVYSVWVDVFAQGTGEPIGTFRSGRTGRDSLRNVFQASADGEGHLAGLAPPGALEEGLIGRCMLSDVTSGAYDWRVLGIYHIDGTPGVDDEGTFVEQVAFEFESDEEPPVVE